ncbi:hypothetical protein [Actinocorallia populi]|uniref:hypothetical protein n=1 Tax=Actinocorallia populi TaxID=2079200 RepID=UPI000D095D5E|nr:hypothetical protein [Actinocorallia populi]
MAAVVHGFLRASSHGWSLGGTIGLAVFAAVLELAAPGATGGEPLARGIARAFLAAAVSAGFGLLLAVGLLAGRAGKADAGGR